MILSAILLLGIYLYLIGKKKQSILIYFFFLTNGFQIIPKEWFDLGFGISKSLDFALIYIGSVFIYEYLIKHYHIEKNKITIYIFIYSIFLFICIVYNIYIYNIPISEITRTTRYNLFILTFFSFKCLKLNDYKYIINKLQVITLLISILYLLQIPLQRTLLTGFEIGSTLYKSDYIRFYNYPIYSSFFLFYSFFNKTKYKYLFIIVFTLTTIAPLHRSLILVSLICLLYGIYKINKNITNVFKYVLITIIITLPFWNLLSNRFEKGNTSNDIEKILHGNYTELSGEDTFSYRIAHFMERFNYLLDEKKRIFISSGLMTEDSDLTQKYFDFKIGLVNENTGLITQLDTGDIAWSALILRYGIIGTVLYLIIIIKLLSIYSNSFFNKEYIKLIYTHKIYIALILYLSLFSNNIINQSTLVLPFFVYNYIKTLQNNERRLYVHAQNKHINTII